MSKKIKTQLLRGINPILHSKIIHNIIFHAKDMQFKDKDSKDLYNLLKNHSLENEAKWQAIQDYLETTNHNKSLYDILEKIIEPFIQNRKPLYRFFKPNPQTFAIGAKDVSNIDYTKRLIELEVFIAIASNEEMELFVANVASEYEKRKSIQQSEASNTLHMLLQSSKFNIERKMGLLSNYMWAQDENGDFSYNGKKMCQVIWETTSFSLARLQQSRLTSVAA